MAIKVHIDVLLARRKMSAGDLAASIGITPANLSILKNDKPRPSAFRRSTRSAANSTASRAIS